MRPSHETVRILFALLTVFGLHSLPAEPAPSSLASLTGAEVINSLSKQETRQLAFYELCRRAGEAGDGFGLFKLSQAEPIVLLSFQSSGPPLYVVVYGPLKERHLSVQDFQKAETKRFSKFRSYTPGFYAFNAEGEMVPNMDGRHLRGILADVNADGMLELVDTSPGIEITPICPDPKPLLSLRPVGGDKWKFRLCDDNQDGVWEIEGGLQEQEIFTRKEVWKWDIASKTYVGPDNGEGFSRYREESDKTRRRRIVRAPVPPLKSLVYTEQVTRPKEIYRHKSLRHASDEELFQFLGYTAKVEPPAAVVGKKNHLPKGFWERDARAMALEYLKGNSSAKVRSSYRVSLEKSKESEPPSVCTVSFSNFSSRCFAAEDSHYFLKVDPLGSYLALASTRSDLSDSAKPEFDFRWCEVRYEDARKVSDVIWWLDRVRTRPLSAASEFSTTWSSADGSGRLVLRAPDGTLIRLDDTLWHDLLGERWKNDFGTEVYLNFAANLVEKELPARLADRWAAPKDDALSELALRLLTLFSLDETKISFAVTSQAARYAGYMYLSSAAEMLRKIVSNLPSSPSRRAREIVGGELQARGHSAEDGPKRDLLKKELAEIDAAAASDSPEYLRRSAEFSLQQIAKSRDADALYKLAISEDPLASWAQRRLAAINPARYADALEWCTFHKIDPESGSNYFQELARVDPVRAKKAAEKVPKDGIGPLTLEVFDFLREQGADVRDRIPGLFGAMKSKSCKESRIARVLDSLALLAQQDPSEFKPLLQQRIRAQFEDPLSNKEALLWTVWSAGLRDLDSEVESIASGQTPDQKGAVRTAKIIAGLWQESDPLTKCRMLTALALLQPDEFWGNDSPGKTLRMKTELDNAVEQLEERAAFRKFLDRRDMDPLRSKSREAILSYLRQDITP